MKLELGGGNRPTEGYFNIDLLENENVDLSANLMALFTPDADIEDYPELKRFQQGESVTHVKATHFVEHIPWIYHDSMWRWINHILVPDGIAEIVTPNLEYIAKVYVKRRRTRIKNRMYSFFGKKLELFPDTDHPKIGNNKSRSELSLWVNFKLYSGCSLGDYHHCLYDKTMVLSLLKDQVDDNGKCIWKNINVESVQDEIRISVFKYTANDNDVYY